MKLSDAREGLHVRFSHHDSTRAGGGETPVFRLRRANRYVTEEVAGVHTVQAVEDGWERVVVVSRFPYARGVALPFTAANASQFVPCAKK